MLKRHWLTTLLLIVLVLLTSACDATANATTTSSAGAPASFTLVYQPGPAAALITLKTQKTLEKQFPNTHFQWKVVNSGSAVREAILSGQGQLGSLGLPPFLVGWDRGVNWRVLTALSRSDAWLVTRNPRIKSLKDFGPNDKIGVVAPDSQQAILIRKAAQEQLGNPHALDANLLSISSADGEAALDSGQLTAQLSGSPFQQREVKAGAHIILHTKDIFGPVGTGVIAIVQSVYNQYPNFVKTLYQDINNATEFAETHHDQVAQYLAQDPTSGGGTVASFKALLDDPTITLTTTPSGLLTYATFMQSIGLISKVPARVQDLELPVLENPGS